MAIGANLFVDSVPEVKLIAIPVTPPVRSLLGILLLSVRYWSDSHEFSFDSGNEADSDTNSDPDSDNISDEPVSDANAGAGANEHSDNDSDFNPDYNYDADSDADSDTDSDNISDPVSDAVAFDSGSDYDADSDTDPGSDPDSDNTSDPESDAEGSYYFTHMTGSIRHQIHILGPIDYNDDDDYRFALWNPARAESTKKIPNPYFRFPIANHIFGLDSTKEYKKVRWVPKEYNTPESWNQIENLDDLAPIRHNIFINGDFDVFSGAYLFDMGREINVRNNYVRLPHCILNVSSSLHGWAMKQNESHWNDKHFFTLQRHYINNTSRVQIAYRFRFWKKEEVFVETTKNKLVFECNKSLILQSKMYKWRNGTGIYGKLPFGISSLMHQTKKLLGWKWRIH